MSDEKYILSADELLKEHSQHLPAQHKSLPLLRKIVNRFLISQVDKLDNDETVLFELPVFRDGGVIRRAWQEYHSQIERELNKSGYYAYSVMPLSDSPMLKIKIIQNKLEL